ncbi:GIY-YIG nuclease family protein [Polaribacter irgensii]|uniref:GIY-YIG nuclease family protein n=1 Tax=Polaribacter irgensii TaxID=531 RepID=UPI0009D77C01|nr:GIY-YIG nuclease family protein [Polaribacter irgensii]
MDYVGFTSNFEELFFKHQEGKYKGSYIHYKRSLKLVFYPEFSDLGFAIEVEKQIKMWVKTKKEALMNKESEKLPNLAKKNFKYVF